MPAAPLGVRTAGDRPTGAGNRAGLFLERRCVSDKDAIDLLEPSHPRSGRGAWREGLTERGSLPSLGGSFDMLKFEIKRARR